MNGNGSGRRYRTSWKMKEFDKLPVETREALANAVENWKYTNPISADTIAWCDAHELKRREYERAHALGVYHGNAPDKPPSREARSTRAR